MSPSPELAEKEEDADAQDATEASGEEEEATAAPAPDEAETESVDFAMTDVASSGADPEGFFDSVEKDAPDAKSGDDSLFDGTDDAEDGDDDDDGPSEAAGTRSSGLAGDLNAGFARAAVIGLDDEWETASGDTRKKADLQQEFQETFEAFRLGHYSAEVAEEYLLVDNDDIDPVWGLVGAMLICAAVIIYRRPDGDQMVEGVKLRLGNVDISKFTPTKED